MSIGEICDRNVVIVGKDDSIYTAACLMRDHCVSDVVVVESSNGINVPVGIISDRDIVVTVVAEGLSLEAVSIGDVINNQFMTANEDDDVTMTLRRLRHKGVSRAPVISQNGDLIGIFSIDHVLDMLEEQLNHVNHIIVWEQHKKPESLAAMDNTRSVC